MKNAGLTLWMAPMEGVVDWSLRKLYRKIGGADRFVTEFIRVTHHMHSDEILYSYIPELRTPAEESDIIPQLLGSDPDALLMNASRLVELGAAGIDLNFGCPAKTVNRHDGGAVLLKSPQRLFQIAQHLRKNLPSHIPISAKIRLGFESPQDCLENAQALDEAGVSHLTVHCRTKMDMYRPPAYWEWIPKIREVCNLPLIANGEIWNLEDFRKCQEITGCDQFMLGRGALRDPFLFKKIKQAQGLLSLHDNAKINTHLLHFFDEAQADVSPHFAVARTKQWLRNMVSTDAGLLRLFDQIKTLQNPHEFRSHLL